MSPRVMAMSFALVMVLSLASFASVPYTGVVSIDTVDGRAGQTVVVPIRLADNNIHLAAIDLPLNYNSSALRLDSVSFVGSLLPTNMTGAALNDSVNKTVEITYLPPTTGVFPLPLVTATSGVIANMYFHVDPAATAGYVRVDSLYSRVDLGGGVSFVKQLLVTDSSGDANGTFFPAFIPGAVNVLTPTGVNDNNSSGLPRDFALLQNYPNPFNPSTVIPFSLPVASHVKMEVFNILGQNMATLLDENMSAGNHQVRFDASLYPSGIYFYRWTHAGGSETRKMLLIK